MRRTQSPGRKKTARTAYLERNQRDKFGNPAHDPVSVNEHNVLPSAVLEQIRQAGKRDQGLSSSFRAVLEFLLALAIFGVVLYVIKCFMTGFQIEVFGKLFGFDDDHHIGYGPKASAVEKKEEAIVRQARPSSEFVRRDVPVNRLSGIEAGQLRAAVAPRSSERQTSLSDRRLRGTYML